MGVQNLWLLLSPAAQKVAETALSSQRLAIDISIWVLNLIHGHISHNFSIENAHLLGVFKRLLRLLSLNVRPVFVFDGKTPELKRKTVIFRATQRKLNIKKLAEKILVKQLEGKSFAIKPESFDEKEDSFEEILSEESKEDEDLLRNFEKELERQNIEALLKENAINKEIFEEMDAASKQELVKSLKLKAFEERQAKFQAIEDKAEFSKAQLSDYLLRIQEKKAIEDKKKELVLKTNEEIIRENAQNLENQGFAVKEVKVSKDFVVAKRKNDEEIERVRNLMMKVPKPIRKPKKEKLKHCAEKLEEFIQEKLEKSAQKYGFSRRIEENPTEKPEITEEKLEIPLEKMLEIPLEKHQIPIENKEIPLEIPGKLQEIGKTVENRDKFTEKPVLFENPLPRNKEKSLETQKFESLRKEFQENEVKKLVSSHFSSRSSSQSRQNPVSSPQKMKPSPKLPQSSQKSSAENPVFVQQELDFMESFLENQEEDTEMESAFLRISSLNSLSDSLSTKFEQIKHLLRLFGVPWIESPFEAEAQCAFLEKHGLVDGIITEDSDVFLFGGRRVFRGVFKEKDEFQLYDMRKIEENLGLCREKLISLALFLGSDYTMGVKGVGIVNAMEIVNAFETVESLNRFKQWAEKPDVLLENYEEFYQNIPLKELHYKQFHKNYKKNWEFPEVFPDFEVVDGYLKPNVDESLQPLAWNEPDIQGIQQFCRENFAWCEEKIEDVGKELRKIEKKRKEEGKQRKIEEFFREKTVGIVKSKRLGAAIKGMREKDLKEKEELEKFDFFVFKRE